MTAKPRTLVTCICALLVLFAASAVVAQNPTQSSTPVALTTDQKASLEEAAALSRRVTQLHRAKKFDEAIPLGQRAVELRRSVLGERDSLVAESVSNLAALYVGKEDYERGENQFRSALAIYDSSGAVTENMGLVLDSLAILRWRVADYSKAESYAIRAMELNQKVHGEQSTQFLHSLNTVIKIYNSAGKTDKRNALILRSISVLENSKADIINRQSLVSYYCALRPGKQTPEVEGMIRRLEALLKWEPSPSPTSIGILNGRAISLQKPAYPDEARKAHASGTVVVEIEIDECGNVSSAKAISGPAILRKACESAARGAKFTPTVVNGSPIRVTGVIQYNFVAL